MTHTTTPGAETSPHTLSRADDNDGTLPVELCMSTHLAVVVNVRMEAPHGAEHTGLVIPRSACEGDQPKRHALVTAALNLLMRHPDEPRRKTVPQRVLARINGRWTALAATALPVVTGMLMAATAGLSPTSAMAAQSETMRAAQATYQAERKACLEGRTSQDRATCLKEAGAALDEAKRNPGGSGEGRDQRQRNALARCEAVPAADQADCRRMARGEGTRSGSVAGGGVVKELVTTVPAAPAPAASR